MGPCTIHVDTDEPVMLLPDFWLGTAEKTTWYQDFVLHHASHSDPNDFVNLLVSVISDRGWSSSQPVDGDAVEEIKRTARVVVGPDEPAASQTRAEVEAN